MRLSNRGQSCGQTVRDIFLYTLPVYLPFYQALLVHGVSRAIVFMALAVLLMFVTAHRAEIGEACHAFLMALRFPLAVPVQAFALRTLAFATLAVPEAPSPAALFQRPPPLFA